ncbi:IclR family transcriptional regulator C-terminal domain-containing protein [Nonomuraea sp. NPDC050202]|uniref:IclR family transcriptional regulator domain-containing protein n=1 Tax=Nonomuraea sp. NPDC050202 TaxID=3155035 RepID=UPI0033E5568F
MPGIHRRGAVLGLPDFELLPRAEAHAQVEVAIRSRPMPGPRLAQAARRPSPAVRRGPAKIPSPCWAELARRLERPTRRTLTEPGRLAREPAAVRAQGYALTYGEVTAGSCWAAAPIVVAGRARRCAGHRAVRAARPRAAPPVEAPARRRGRHRRGLREVGPGSLGRYPAGSTTVTT